MNSTSGIIEICDNGVWRTVCEPFSNISTEIVCNQLGFYDRSGNLIISIIPNIHSEKELLHWLVKPSSWGVLRLFWIMWVCI